MGHEEVLCSGFYLLISISNINLSGKTAVEREKEGINEEILGNFRVQQSEMRYDGMKRSLGLEFRV